MDTKPRARYPSCDACNGQGCPFCWLDEGDFQPPPWRPSPITPPKKTYWYSVQAVPVEPGTRDKVDGFGEPYTLDRPHHWLVRFGMTVIGTVNQHCDDTYTAWGMAAWDQPNPILGKHFETPLEAAMIIIVNDWTLYRQ